MSSNYAVSIIVPIYNVEAYIERCARSLFEQTLDSIEYIFVDDCSPDNSIALLEKVLESYPNRKKDVKILHHEVNQGLVAARQTALKAASGEYVIPCDSDDWVDKKMYQTLYEKAKEDDCDLVYCGYYEVKDNKLNPCTNIKCNSKETAIRAIIVGTLGGYLWCKLVRRDIYNKVSFPFGNDMWEDKCTSVQLFYYAERVGGVDSSLYFYDRSNVGSIVNTKSSRHLLSMIANVKNIESFLDEHGLQMDDGINKCKMICKMTMLDNDIEIKSWNMIFPEVNGLLCQKRVMRPHVKLIVWGLNHGITFLYRLYKRMWKSYSLLKGGISNRENVK